jgi:hypothetical protein
VLVVNLIVNFLDGTTSSYSVFLNDNWPTPLPILELTGSTILGLTTGFFEKILLLVADLAVSKPEPF